LNDITTRHNVESLFRAKLNLLNLASQLEQLDRSFDTACQDIHGHRPYWLDYRYENHSDNRQEKYFDRICWRYLVNLFFMEKYMLCTDYKKMTEEIEQFKTPTFTIDNANAWLAGLKDLINENVKTLIKQVYAEIIKGTYYVGSGYNAMKKKRNNMGIDKSFILHTRDWSSTFGYWSNTPTVTDDLEKVCYILSGLSLPEKTAKMVMRDTKESTFNNEYFTLKFCMNGNTHYTLNDDIRDKLNRLGPTGADIGEDIKIKVFESRWGA
jgi:hypothetical protein